MHEHQPFSISPPLERPRHAHQEVAELLAAALLRLRVLPATDAISGREQVGLGFYAQQSVNANPGTGHGVRP